jgi:peptidoglycan/LPS O-acetylase OafA/YrhL
MMKMTDCMTGRDNNFNLIRFIAASCVILSHSVLITGGENVTEPLERLTGFTLGDHAVNVFFVISGFLVAKSLLIKKDLAAYAAARILRIVPGLFVMGLLSAFVMGAALSSLSPGDYFSELSSWIYAPLIGTLATDPLSLTLPGVFASNPFPDMVNGPLWTLRYEAIAYIALVLAAAVGIYANPKRFAGFLMLFVVLFIGYSFWNPMPETRSSLDHLLRFFMAFGLGSAFFMLRERIILRAPMMIGLFVLMLIVSKTPFYHAMLLIFTAYATFWLAFVPAGFIRRFNRFGDYSYGIYIYGWPIAQSMIYLFPELSAPALFMAGYGVTLLVAMASWHGIEKPALAKRFALATLLHSKKPQIA